MSSKRSESSNLGFLCLLATLILLVSIGSMNCQDNKPPAPSPNAADQPPAGEDSEPASAETPGLKINSNDEALEAARKDRHYRDWEAQVKGRGGEPTLEVVEYQNGGYIIEGYAEGIESGSPQPKLVLIVQEKTGEVEVFNLP